MEREIKVAVTVSAVIFVVFIAWTILEIGGPRTTLVFDNLVVTTAVLASSIVCLRASRHVPAKQRRGWLLIGISAGAWGLGNAVWSYYEIVLWQEVPFPSLADVGYLGAVPFAVAGLLALSTPPSAAERWKNFLDGLLIGISTLIVGWVLVLSSVYVSGTGTPLQNTLALAYPAADVVVVAIVIYGFFRSPRIGTVPLALLGAGFLAWAVADSGFALQTATQSYYTGVWFDAGWLAGFLLIALAAQVARSQPAPTRSPRELHPSLQFLPLVAVGLATGAAIVQRLQFDRLDDMVFWLGIAAVATLALRQTAAMLQLTVIGRQARFAAAELAVANQRLSAAQAVSGLGSWEWDVRSGRLVWSDQMYRIFQVDPASFRPTFETYVARIHEDDRQTVQKAIDEGMATGSTFQFQHRIRGQGGHDRVLQCHATVLRDEQGQVERMLGTSQDVTEANLAHEVEDLRRQEEFKRRFMNSAAHELKTPLTPIRLQTHIIKAQAEMRGDDSTRKAADILDRNAARLQEIVDEILQATRLQSGQLFLRKAIIDIATVLRESLASYAAALQAMKFDVEEQIQAPLPANADARRLEQVFNQLLGNAIKFSPQGGKLIVRSHANNGIVRISVQDEGIGMREADIGRIFQPFVQVHDAPITEKGAGLGLFVARGIVEAHGGRIWAESQLGKGTTVVVEIPEGTADELQAGTMPAPSFVAPSVGGDALP